MVQDLHPTKPNGWLYGCLKTVARTGLARALLPASVRPHRILSGPLRGCRIVTSWRNYPAAILGRTEIPLLGWFSANARPGQTWLDVGAQYGYTAIALGRLVGPGGRVFAFEPMLSTAGCLGQTRMLNALPQITVLPLALGNCAGLMPAELEATHGMVDSTLAKSGREGQLVPVWREKFLVASLDWLWLQVCGSLHRVDGIKVDVQGMEIEVLQGMTSILARWKPKLAVEVHPGVDRRALLDVIEASGYARRGSPIEPVEGEVEPQYVDDHSYAFSSNGLKSG